MTVLKFSPAPISPDCSVAALQNPNSKRAFAWKVLAVIFGLATTGTAAQSGNFFYTDDGTSLTITGYAAGAPLAVVIPERIVTSLDPFVEKMVTVVGANAFEGKTDLTSISIPAGVTSIATRAFSDCIAITSVSLPSSLTSIGTYSFNNCRALPNITVPSSVTSIGSSAFAYCMSLSSMPLQHGLTTIGRDAFFRCFALTEVTLPTSVTSIGIGAFYSCISLTNLVIPSSMTSIPASLFYSCTALKSVTIPAGVTSIGADAFRNCSGLTSVTLPSSLTALTSKVFGNCRGLTSVEIPASVTSIHLAAFVECSSLLTFTVAAGNPNYNSLNGLLTNQAQTVVVTCPPGVSGNYTIPLGVTGIGDQAFRSCGKLSGVTIPNTVTSLGNQAFSTCSKLIYAIFMGATPNMGFGVFELAGPGFTIYYLTSGSSFTSPVWMNYPAAYIEAITPVFTWLLSKSLPGNSDLLSDANGDGINLLMAYALNLDPNTINFAPQPVLDGSQMRMSFHAGATGVSYTVKCSEDLQNWSAEEVTLSAPDANQIRTATVGITGPRCFMRLEVSN